MIQSLEQHKLNYIETHGGGSNLRDGLPKRKPKLNRPEIYIFFSEGALLLFYYRTLTLIIVFIQWMYNKALSTAED